MPELRRLLVGDKPEAWIDAGFSVTDNETSIGGIALRFAETTGPGIIGWEMTEIDDGSIDGILSIGTDASPVAPTVHPNGVSHLDHVVVMTPDMERTNTAMRGFGFSVKRTREVPGTDPVKLQSFIWAGETILEVVGPAEATGTGPASIWGLALTTDDMNKATSSIDPFISTPKPAVQPGRQIATINSKGLGMTTALALMTPHVRTGDSPDSR